VLLSAVLRFSACCSTADCSLSGTSEKKYPKKPAKNTLSAAFSGNIFYLSDFSGKK
jgi:hypothetical protein